MTTAHSTNYSFTEKKRIRKNFGKRRSILEVPFLLAIQVDSYREFLQADAEPTKREDRGLHAALKSVFPITSYNGYAALEYVMAATNQPVDWAYEVWDDLVKLMQGPHLHHRAIATTLLCNLAKSDPKRRILKDLPAIMAITLNLLFNHLKVGNSDQQSVFVAGTNRTSEPGEILVKKIHSH